LSVLELLAINKFQRPLLQADALGIQIGFNLLATVQHCNFALLLTGKPWHWPCASMLEWG